MTIEVTLIFISGVAVGCMIGYILMSTIFRPKDGGTINIDRSDPDGPLLFLELTENISALSAKKYVQFKVKNTNYLSQE